eukprot:6204248-Pleurochrysis_carterae.AAC.1
MLLTLSPGAAALKRIVSHTVSHTVSHPVSHTLNYGLLELGWTPFRLLRQNGVDHAIECDCVVAPPLDVQADDAHELLGGGGEARRVLRGGDEHCALRVCRAAELGEKRGGDGRVIRKRVRGT